MSTLSKLRYHQKQIDDLWMEYYELFKPLELQPEIRKKIDQEYQEKKAYHRKQMERIANLAYSDHEQPESISFIQRIRNLFKNRIFQFVIFILAILLILLKLFK